MPDLRHRLQVALILSIVCTSLSAQPARWLWSGAYPAGTRVVSPEMGASFLVPAGVTANFVPGSASINFATPDGAVNGTIWLVSSVDPAVANSWVRANDWTDRQQQPMPLKSTQPQADGRLESVLRSPLDLALGAWKPGPDRAGFGSYIWGAPAHEEKMRTIHDALFASVVHFPASRNASGMYGMNWLGWLVGKKLAAFDTYSGSDGSGYTNEERIDLCWDGSFTQSSSYSASFGQSIGSAAGYDPSRGVWGVDASGPNQCTLIVTVQGGTTLEYGLSYDPQSGHTYVGDTRYFCVPNERCEPPPQPPALPPELLAMLKGATAGRVAQGGQAQSGASPRAAEPVAPEAPPAPAANKLDGTWVAEANGYALGVLGDRFEFYVFDGADWLLEDAGSLTLKPRTLVTRSDGGVPPKSYAYELNGDVLRLDLHGMVRFERQKN